ncbi:MAG: carbon storage regulator CsrA [Spirochaetales bacterium]
MLILARKLKERIVIGDDIEVSVVEIKGDQVKLGISAPPEVGVYRHEVYEAIQSENRAAAGSQPDIPEFSEWLEERDKRSGKDESSPGR